ncbi:hypothetical protein BAU25_05055 [Bacillus albus]|uniref:Uncharacterized protein n=1 Tax=Bacillus albus TaxID=2026189 RepID=A0A1J9UYC1_9BACI|nr:hypothetical protein BAU25_05055 [Bacillus albus]
MSTKNPTFKVSPHLEHIDARYRKMAQYLLAVHCSHNNISLVKLAEKVGINKRQVSRLFRGGTSYRSGQLYCQQLINALPWAPVSEETIDDSVIVWNYLLETLQGHSVEIGHNGSLTVDGQAYHKGGSADV